MLMAWLVPLTSHAQENVPTYDGSIKSILTKRCGKCHGGDQPRGELEIGTFAGVMQGGISGPVVIPGNSSESLLLTLTAHLEEPAMPPNSPKIPASEIESIRKWIDKGAIERTVSDVPMAVETADPAKNQRPPMSGLQPFQALRRSSPVTAVAVSNELGLIAVPAVNSIHLFDLNSRKPKGQLDFPEGEVHNLKFSGNQARLIAAGGLGGDSGAAVVFDTKTWKRLVEIRDDSEAILAADLSNDEKRMVVAGPLKTVKIFEVPQARLIHTFRNPTDWVLATSFSPDGLLVAAGDRFGGLSLWETESGKDFLTLRGHSKAVTALAWNAAGDRLATASEDGTIRLWDLHSGNETNRWVAHLPGVTGLAIAPSGDFISTGRDRMLRIWNEAAEKSAEFGPIADIPTRLAASESYTVVGDWSGQIYVRKAGEKGLENFEIPISEAKLEVNGPIEIPLPELADSRAEVKLGKVDISKAKTTTPASNDGTMPGKVTQADVERKQENLRIMEEAAEKLKTEAASNPANPALTRAYLQLCEAIVLVTADLIQTRKMLSSK